MTKGATTEEIEKKILDFQKNEITEHIVYMNLSKMVKCKNSELLRRISDEELRHYNEWKEYTRRDVPPNRLMLIKNILVARTLGLTFAVKLMERSEEKAQDAYARISNVFPKAKEIELEETEHEGILIGMIDEEMMNYIGSLVLGLNDALVELTGALAGLTLTIQNSRLVGIAGLITGIAASLSMSASEYLSQKSEKSRKSPLRAAFYTGIVYVLMVLLLTAPYLILTDYRIALGSMLLITTLVVLIFTFFISVVKDIPFRKMFLEMLIMSMGVAAISFIIGWIARMIFGIEI